VLASAVLLAAGDTGGGGGGGDFLDGGGVEPLNVVGALSGVGVPNACEEVTLWSTGERRQVLK
jgi:hypothetical protein